MKNNTRTNSLLLLVPLLVCAVVANAQVSVSTEAKTKKSGSSLPKRAKGKTKPPRLTRSAPMASSTTAGLVTSQLGALTVQQRRIVELLERSPFLDPAPPDALGGHDFMIAAKSLLPTAADANNPLDTLRALEAKIQSVGSVNAIISSDPGSLSVQYHRVTDSTSNFNTTTNSVVPLDPPATYVFTCTGPSGVVQSQRISCASGCNVVFKF